MNFFLSVLFKIKQLAKQKNILQLLGTKLNIMRMVDDFKQEEQKKIQL